MWKTASFCGIVFLVVSIQGCNTEIAVPPDPNRPHLTMSGGHERDILALAFSSDGVYLASGGRDFTARVWQVESQKEIAQFIGHSGSVLAVVFAQENQFLVTGGEEGNIIFWDLSTHIQTQNFLAHEGGVLSLSISPDGKTLASGGADGMIKLWQVADVTLLKTITAHTDYIESLEFSADSGTLLSASLDATVGLWDVPSGREKFRLAEHDGEVWEARFVPTTPYIASTGYDRRVRVWEPDSGAIVQTFRDKWPDQFESIDFSDDGLLVITGGVDGFLRIWHREQNKLFHKIDAHKGNIWAVAVAPHSMLFASGATDGVIKLWHADSGELVGTLASTFKRITQAQFTSDQFKMITWADTAQVSTWNVDGVVSQTLAAKDGVPRFLAFAPDGSQVLTKSSSFEANLWQIQKGTQTATFKTTPSQNITTGAISANSQWVALGSYGGYIHLFDAMSGAKKRQFGKQGVAVTSVEISQDSQNILSGGRDNLAILWNLNTGKALQTLKGHRAFVESVALNADAKWAITGSRDSTAIVWDLTNSSQVSVLPHSEKVVQVKISQTGNYLFTLDASGSATIWNRSGEKLATLAQTYGIRTGSFSLDERMLLTTDVLGKTEIWSVKNGLKAFELYEQMPKMWVITQSDGRFVTSNPPPSNLYWVVNQNIQPFEALSETYNSPELLKAVFLTPEDS